MKADTMTPITAENQRPSKSAEFNSASVSFWRMVSGMLGGMLISLILVYVGVSSTIVTRADARIIADDAIKANRAAIAAIVKDEESYASQAGRIDSEIKSLKEAVSKGESRTVELTAQLVGISRSLGEVNAKLDVLLRGRDGAATR